MTRGTGLTGKRGALADLHEYLRGHGYGYGYRHDDLTLVYLGEGGTARLLMAKIRSGRPARQVHRRISPTMWQTREHATPDVYEVRSERRRPRKR